MVDAALNPDVYEANNTENAPATLQVNFSGNTASVNTAGSNIHVGTDIDYYQIILPSGTNYQISASVYDKYNLGGGNYTNDEVFSYSVNGGAWSNAYDDVMPGTIDVVGGGTVKFGAASYFQGSTGTYQLNLQITRGAALDVADIATNKISVFPNPAKEEVFVDAGDAIDNYGLKIYNLLGEEVKEMNGNLDNHLLKVNISTLSAGIYNLQLKTAAGISSAKIMVR